MSLDLPTTFRSGGEPCAADLLLPGGGGPHPVVVMGHGLGAVRAMGLPAYARRFRDAGYACLVFDYRRLGGSGGGPRQLLDVGDQLQDWSAAVAHARRLPALDPDRVVLWGYSLGAGHALTTATADRRVAAVIAHCPFTDGVASAMAANPLSAAKVFARAVADLVGARLGHPPRMAATVGPPRSPAFMTSPDAAPGYLALTPADSGFRNELAARAALGILRYRPIRHVDRVTAPILFSLCARDDITPAPAALRCARKARRAETTVHDAGHFDVYSGDVLDRAVADHLDFLSRHVPLRPAT